MEQAEAILESLESAQKRVGAAAEQMAAEVEGATAQVNEAYASTAAATAELDATAAAATEAGVATAEASAASATAAEASSERGVGSLGKIGLAAGAATALFAGFATKLGIDWQDAMTSLAASASIPEDAANKIGDALTGLSDKTTFSAETITGALSGVAGQWEQYTGKALDASQSTNLMSVAAKEAQATHGDLDATTQGLVSTLIAFHEPASAASSVMDELYNTSKATGTSVPDLTGAMDKLAGRLGNVSPTLGDVSALTDELAQRGISGSRGILTMSTAFETLLGGSNSVNTELTKLGLNIYDAQGHFIGMGPVIEQLQGKMAGLTDAQKNQALSTLFGASAGGIMAGVLKDGSAKFDQYKDSLSETGTVQDAYNESQRDLGNQITELQHQADNLVREFGTYLVGAILKVEDVVGPYVRTITDLVEKHKSIQVGIEAVGAVILGIVALWGVYTVATAAASAATAAWAAVTAVATAATAAFGIALAVAMSPITLVIAAIALLAFGIYELIEHWDQVSAAVKTAWDDVLSVVQTAVSTVLGFLESHWQLIVGILTGPIGIAVLLIIDNWAKIQAATEATWDAVKGMLTSAWDDIRATFTGALSAITRALSDAWHAIQTAATTAWDAVEALFVAAWDAIKATITTVTDAVKATVAAFLTAIQTAFETAWDAIQATVSTVIGAISGAIQSALYTIEGALSGAWSTIEGTASSAWGTIETTIANIMSNLYSDVTSFGEDIVSYFSGLPGEILGAIGDLGSLLFHAGASLIQGLINGINSLIDKIPGGSMVTSALGSVGGFISGLASGGLADANVPILVGEKGPELFIPNVNGMVVPNHVLSEVGMQSPPAFPAMPAYPSPASSGAVVNVFTVSFGDVHAANPQDFADQVSRIMKDNVFTGIRVP